MTVALELDINQEAWTNAAIAASNLIELQVTLGRLTEAVGDVGRSLELADRSKYTTQQIINLGTAAVAVHQFGGAKEKSNDALALFQEAERRQRKIQPEFTVLYSLGNFIYCDLLLSPIECAAWQTWLVAGSNCRLARYARDKTENPTQIHLASCAEVEHRIKKVFDWGTPDDPLLDIALRHLIKGRLRFFNAFISRQLFGVGESDSNLILLEIREFQGAASVIEQAVLVLRQASNLHYLPKGLLSNAWIQALLGNRIQAIRDLDEALQIAERGPMPLYITDTLLTRARLFGVRTKESYPWPDSSPAADLVAARKIIEETHYHRRLPELEDAEAALRK